MDRIRSRVAFPRLASSDDPAFSGLISLAEGCVDLAVGLL